MLGLVVRLVFSLAIVLGLLLLIARFAGRRFQGRAGAPVQVLHRQPITRGSSVAVVTVGTRVLVLGTTEQQVTLLTELEPDEIDLPEQAPDLLDADTPARGSKGQVPAGTGPLNGSLLSPQTWKQALAAATRASGATSTASENQAS
ncbi:flagellar biosynthetic protein FliO [Nocardioides sp. CER19]|uniref:flagellar biosynthetic protein FliO n=1 Tax=Nocardioides sp. CER19 TaxID=3038538 RepID=UPI002449E872|nr:flagellar biosynthetic protein FliO [Nocardioides sp. CER19]MDH2414616.1 flagellar biosynthetic protein FliO [Nocardioides sp. CER19]